MVFARTIIIPAIYPTSIHGTIAGDPQYYNALALEKSAAIKTQGFSAFELRPAGQGPAGIASLIYLFSDNSSLIVLMNAVLHAVSAAMMVSILKRWFTIRVSLIAALPLVISPYMIMWFSQLNKDSFTVAGAMLFTYGLIGLVDVLRRPKSPTVSIFILLAGASLISLMRPYMIQMLIPISAVVILFHGICLIRQHHHVREVGKLAISGFAIIACLAFMTTGAASDNTLKRFNSQTTQPVAEGKLAQTCLSKVELQWRDEQYLPNYFNKKLRAIMGARCLIFNLLDTQTNLTTRLSILDTNVLPGGTVETLAYTPRAAMIGIFSPWPNSWFYIIEKRSFFYVVAPLEAAFLYAGMIGLIFWLMRRKAWGSLTPIALSLSMMTLYGMSTPFLGALYRYRYPWWMIMLCFGFASLLSTNKGFTLTK
jgi:hypothetical protein